jgi:siroheme synthase (precorrin-2 oxidase/ferrochelatase)
MTSPRRRAPRACPIDAIRRGFLARRPAWRAGTPVAHGSEAHHVSAFFESPSPPGTPSCLVVGGGVVAERMLGPLLEAGALVTVVSPTLAPGLLEVARDGRLRWWPREYVSGDVAGFALVLAATDDAAVNACVVGEARECGVRVAEARVPADRGAA